MARYGLATRSLSVSINLGGATTTTEPQGSPDRGTTLKINRSTGAEQHIAGGLCCG